MAGLTSTTKTSPRSPPSKSMSRSPFWNRLCSHLGFQKTYNFLLFFLLGLIGIMGQGFLHAPKLDYFNVFCRRNHLSKGLHAAPGECYYFRNGGREQIGMMLHVYTVVPVCFLLVLQFVPIIRQRWILVHRVGGYAVLLLMGVAVGGGLMASGGSFGGELAWQTLVWLLGGMILGGFGMAMGNIWRLQVEQHRAWMLRTWAWAFSSITMRLLQQVGAHLISLSTSSPSHYHYSSLRSCAQIASDGVMPDFAIVSRWPACLSYFSGHDPDQAALVTANYGGAPIEANVALSLAAGPAGWVALLLHIVAVEVYLHLTASESQRLRQVSYHKQRAAGMRHPGSAGLTADRLGESPRWFPRVRSVWISESKLDIKSLDGEEKKAGTWAEAIENKEEGQ